MTHLRSVAAATELGLLAASAPDRGEAEHALELLDRIVPSDASVLQSLDDDGTEPLELAARNIPAPVRDELTAAFFAGPYLPRLLGAVPPPSISTEPVGVLDGLSFYHDHLRPHGFRDGMSAELVHRGRRVGFVHLSASREAFGQEPRELLGSVLPALARLVDLPSRLVPRTTLPAGSRAALLAAGRLLPLPGHALPALLDEASFRTVVDGVRARPGTRLCGLWPGRGSWCRFTLQPVRHGPAGSDALLLHTVEVPAPHGLSSRELEVLTCLALGMGNAQIAETFTISPRTVHTHVDSVLRKTGSTSRAQAGATARRDGLVRPLPQLADQGIPQLAVEL